MHDYQSNKNHVVLNQSISTYTKPCGLYYLTHLEVKFHGLICLQNDIQNCYMDLVRTTRSESLLFFSFYICYNTLVTLGTQSNSIMHGCTWTSVLFNPINGVQVVVYFGSLLGHSRIKRKGTATCHPPLQHKGFQRPRVGLCTSKKA